jgi:hypothetical protein
MDVTTLTPRMGDYVIVCEETGLPYVDPEGRSGHSRRTAFSRLFGRFRVRAGVDRGKWFSDLRRTALSELGNSGSTETELNAIGGHAQGSQMSRVYVIPDKAASLAATQKRWNQFRVEGKQESRKSLASLAKPPKKGPK